MKHVFTALFAIALCGALPLAVAANGPGGGGHPAARPQAGRPAPAARQAPPVHPSQGFNLSHDVPARIAPARVAPVNRPPIRQEPARSPAHGRPVQNPRQWSRPWQWNRGLAWEDAPNYWGGGFWGPLSIGLALSAYVADADTPGYELLQEYQLTQTPCGQPNLVVIYGPDNSEICAYPNDLVAPGNYDVDPSTLTLVSE
jgi:hypothetical protein